MANTTNYNWETPDDTDLVKDGAAAIRTLGSSIDTTTKNLNPQTTTGALAYRSATANVNTALPIGTAGQILAVSGGVPAWINNDQGDITEVQAGVGISVASGTGPIPVITNSSTDLITTAGDLLYGTAADTVARLGIGTANQVLRVNSGATAPEWATPAAAGFVGCSLYNSSSYTIANTTNTNLTFNTELFDTDGFHSTSTNTDRITIPTGKGGKYLITYAVAYDANATGERQTRLMKNGSTTDNNNRVWSGFGSSAGLTTMVVARVVEAVATDYFTIRVYQSSGGDRTIYSGSTFEGWTHFDATYLGA